MLIGTLLVEVHIPQSGSLKEKRTVIKSMIQRIQNRFNVSIAEINNKDLWQRATVGVAMVGDNRAYLERKMQLLINFMDDDPRWEVIKVETDWC
ncbi:MAG: DUF503 domain-containing protein [Bacillota bacterium]|nr:DUF503 domain-containing protein [Bacillota bacterium]HHU60728.1 DUF503 domain-containing protein [Natronincola sp.]